MKLRSPLIALVLAVAFIGGIGLTIAFNLWKTESGKNVADLQKPADIKGSHNFSLIAEAFAIPLTDLLAAFGEKEKTDIQCKELEAVYEDLSGGEIGTDSVRLFVALYRGLDFTPEETTLLPRSAYPILKDVVTPEGMTLLENHLASTEQMTAISHSSSSSRSETTETNANAASEELLIKGSTTFQNLLDFGLSTAQIEAVIGVKIENRSQTIKALADARGIEFSTWRTALQNLLETP